MHVCENLAIKGAVRNRLFDEMPHIQIELFALKISVNHLLISRRRTLLLWAARVFRVLI